MEITVNCDGCPMEAALRDLRDQIAELKAHVKELEKRPIITAEPIEPISFDHLYRPWLVTYHADLAPDQNTTHRW